MDKDDLLRMLDLSPDLTEPEKDKSDILDFLPGGDYQAIDRLKRHKENQPTSEYCLVVDDWDIAHGEEQFVNRKIGIAVTNFNFTDFFALAFLPYPQMEPNPFDKRCQQFINGLMESPDFQALHQATQMDLLASEAACNNMADEFNKLQGLGILGEHCTEEQLENAIYKAISSVVEESEEEIEELFACQNALGIGKGQGSTSPLEAKQIKETFKRVTTNRYLDSTRDWRALARDQSLYASMSLGACQVIGYATPKHLH